MTTYFGAAYPAWPYVERDRTPEEIAMLEEYLDRVAALGQEYGFRFITDGDALCVAIGDEVYFTDVEIDEHYAIEGTITKRRRALSEEEGRPIYEERVRRYEEWVRGQR